MGTTLYGGMETGGTKIVCATSSSEGRLLDRVEFPTTTPDESLQRAAEFFRRATGLAAIGIGSFGPVDLQSGSPTWGFITATPKTAWRHTDVASRLRRLTGVPSVAFDTDVNAAALGEGRWGAAQGFDTFLYVTVGTGIGGGAVVEGRLLHGSMHPEMGHVRIPHDRQRDPFPGVCPYHGDCLEGLACGKAIAERWGCPGEELPPGHPAWDLEAQYLALALVNWTCVLSPQRVVLGGGVTARIELESIRSRMETLVGGYLTMPTLCRPALGNDSGVLGAIALAMQADGIGR